MEAFEVVAVAAEGTRQLGGTIVAFLELNKGEKSWEDCEEGRALREKMASGKVKEEVKKDESKLEKKFEWLNMNAGEKMLEA